MPPTFYFACGARPCWRDVELAITCGQTTFLVPAGSRAADQLRRIPGVRVVLDSGAWPPNNPDRLSCGAYARAIRAWCGHGAFAWACTYDTIGQPKQTEHDHAWLLAQPWPQAEPPIVPIIHYPHSTADAIIGELLSDLDLLDEEERCSTARGTARWTAPSTGRPARSAAWCQHATRPTRRRGMRS